MPITRVCEREGCDREFETYPSRIKAGGGRFCGVDCAHPRLGEDRQCPTCGTWFYAKNTRIMRGYDTYCCKEHGDHARGATGEANGNWSGGEYIDSRGYRWVLCTDGTYEMEHRLVMSQKIGRQLEPDEHVHHKNENKLDNRVRNLEIIDPTSHAIHHNHKRARDRIQKRKNKR